MTPKIIDDQPIRRMSEFSVMFGNCGRSFLSPTIYINPQAKRIAISGFVLQSSIHFCSASTNAVHLPRLPS